MILLPMLAAFFWWLSDFKQVDSAGNELSANRIERFFGYDD